MRNYFFYSSIFLHIIILAWLVYIFSGAFGSHNKWIKAFDNPKAGVVTKSVLTHIDGKKLRSYSIELNGEEIFVSDSENYEIGDEVNLIITDDEYGEEGALSIMIGGKSDRVK